MKLNSLRIKGVLRFRDEVVIDFAALGPGLIAFTGAIGQGKTTGLEGSLACVYREFPSRSSKEILDYATGTDSFIESTFELEGRGSYRARLNLDGPHRRSEAVLAQLLPTGPVFLSDGKLTSFDQAIAKILPPKALMLASVFAAQDKSGSFSTLDRKGRRELFASLLGLEHLQAMSERGKAAAALVQQAIETLTAVRDVLARDTGEAVERALEQRAQQLQEDGGQVEARRVELQLDLDAIEHTLGALREAAAAHATAQTKADRLDVDILSAMHDQTVTRQALDRRGIDAKTERDAITTATATALGALDRQIADTSAFATESKRINDTLASTLKDADERLAGNRNLKDIAADIRHAVKMVAAADEAAATLRAQQQETATAVEGLTRRERVLVDALGAIEQAETELRRITSDAALLEQVPCGGTGIYASCRFLTNVTEAQTRLPALREVAASRPAADHDVRTVRTLIAGLAASATGFQKRIATLATERAGHAKLAGKLGNLELAEERIAIQTLRKTEATTEATRQHSQAQAREIQRQADLRARLAERETEGHASLQSLFVRSRSREDELTTLLAVHAETVRTATAARQALTEELARTADASRQAAEQSALLTLRRQEWDRSTAALASVTHQRAALDSDRAAFAARAVELAALDVRLTALHTDLIEWTVLSKALGRDGLQTLEIDLAGPTVSKLTNDLLESSYGPRFTIDLVTTEPKASKGKDGSTHKEVFSVQVIDARDGGAARDISDLSGGEKTLVEEALKSAIAILVNTRNVHPVRSCWRDETTGSLDDETAIKYMAMLRRVLELGGFHQLLYITHSPDCAALADAQVQFADGQVEVVLPPYGAAA